MLETKLIVQSKIPHNAQIITGFLRLKAQGYPVEIVDQTKETDVSMEGMPMVVAVSARGDACLRSRRWVQCAGCDASAAGEV